MSQLHDNQVRFTQMVAKLIAWVYEHGYEVTFGETYRPPELCKLYAKQGKGIVKSFHCQRLAIDLNLFIDGIYKTDTASYTPLGEYWESIGGTWGGRFKRADGCHLSVGE